MLIIRQNQLEALDATDLRSVEAMVLKVLRDRHAILSTGLSDAYLSTLFLKAVATCRIEGNEAPSDYLDFTEALLTDDVHPLTPQALSAKAERLARDSRARDLFQKLQSLQASIAPEGVEAATAE